MDQHLTPKVKHENTSPQIFSTVPPDVMTDISTASDPTTKLLMTDKLEPLLQMQKTDPFYKRISKQLLDEKALKHERDIFSQVRGLLYKHVTDSGQKFLTLVNPKSRRHTVMWKCMIN